MHSDALDGDLRAILAGRHGDPFSVLGMHQDGGKLVVRTFQPGAERVRVLEASTGEAVAELDRLHADGLFAGPLGRRRNRFAYRLQVTWPGHEQVVEDPYRFPLLLTDYDLYLWAEGTHYRIHEKLGAHVAEIGGIGGVRFAVWAPNAQRVSVVGDFNFWDGRRHPMRLRREAGIWELFIPQVPVGALYKYEIIGAQGDLLPLKADPFGFHSERPPNTASAVCDIDRIRVSNLGDARQSRSDPIAVYEVHLGSWRRHPQDNRYLSYSELADQLVPYVKDMGFTHIELLPITEHPFDGSWGYQPVGLFAPTSRFGAPGDFRHFMQRCHDAGLAVILDWVPGHFPTDPHGLGRFDGTALYEHADPRQGLHLDWNTLIYNYGRREVMNYLLSNAFFWLEKYGMDGLRVDAVASMLYLDYSRPAGGWVPNEQGGRENLAAIALLKRMNELVYGNFPNTTTIAEESTAWPMFSQPTDAGGLGFGFKWNMGWMHDTLRYMATDPLYRRWHHNDLTFGLIYAFSENFVLPLSHDEVVHGKGSLIGKMPGDRWQKFANLRAYFGFMYGHPGKKLLFMGGEIAQEREWNHDSGLDWHLLDDPMHQGMQRLVRDLNHVYREMPALHRLDAEPAGFEWLEASDAENSVLAFLRRGDDGSMAAIVCNFTPEVRHGYRLGVPEGGFWVERLNTDAGGYGGSNVGNGGGVEAEDVERHGRRWSVELTLPPLATMILHPR